MCPETGQMATLVDSPDYYEFHYLEEGFCYLIIKIKKPILLRDAIQKADKMISHFTVEGRHPLKEE
jgi:hypothetical protein